MDNYVFLICNLILCILNYAINDRQLYKIDCWTNNQTDKYIETLQYLKSIDKQTDKLIYKHAHTRIKKIK